MSIKVYADSNNILDEALGEANDHVLVLGCGLLLEEFSPEFVYIEGAHNTIAEQQFGWIAFFHKQNCKYIQH